MGFIPIYLPIGQNDFEDFKVLKKSGIKCLELNSISHKDILNYLNTFDFVISGRHHLNIFCILAGVPFIPLSSNTWKIESVCKLMDYTVKGNSLEEQIEFIQVNASEIRESFLDNTNYLKSLAQKNIIC